MEEKKENLAPYHILIKQQQPSVNLYNFSYNDPRRQAAQDAAKAKSEEIFIKVVNEVVEQGGVICMDKQQLNDEWRLFSTGFAVRLRPSSVPKIEAMPEVQSCKPIA